MRQRLISLIASLLFLALFGLTNLATAVSAADSCGDFNILLSESNLPNEVESGDQNSYVVSIAVPPHRQNLSFELVNFEKDFLGDDERGARIGEAGRSGSSVSFIIDDPTWFVNGSGDNDNMKVELWSTDGSLKCEIIPSYTIAPIIDETSNGEFSCAIAATQTNSSGEETAGCFDDKSDITVFLSNVTLNGEPYTSQSGDDLSVALTYLNSGAGTESNPISTIGNGSAQFTISSDRLADGGEVAIGLIANRELICSTQNTLGRIEIREDCTDEERGEDIIEDSGDIIDPLAGGEFDPRRTGNNGEPLEWDLCTQVTSEHYGACDTCQNSGGVWTAIGCITHTPGGIVTQVMQVGLSIAGGIALLSIIAAAFKFTISKGDPKNVGEAKELLQSAIIGLLFIVFSVVILQFIGVTIFRIPGFGS